MGAELNNNQPLNNSAKLPTASPASGPSLAQRGLASIIPTHKRSLGQATEAALVDLSAIATNTVLGTAAITTKNSALAILNFPANFDKIAARGTQPLPKIMSFAIKALGKALHVA